MNMELISTGLHIGKIVITSPAVQGVVSSLITTVFVRREKILKQWRLLSHENSKK